MEDKSMRQFISKILIAVMLVTSVLHYHAPMSYAAPKTKTQIVGEYEVLYQQQSYIKTPGRWETYTKSIFVAAHFETKKVKKRIKVGGVYKVITKVERVYVPDKKKAVKMKRYIKPQKGLKWVEIKRTKLVNKNATTATKKKSGPEPGKVASKSNTTDTGKAKEGSKKPSTTSIPTKHNIDVKKHTSSTGVSASSEPKWKFGSKIGKFTAEEIKKKIGAKEVVITGQKRKLVPVIMKVPVYKKIVIRAGKYKYVRVKVADGRYEKIKVMIKKSYTKAIKVKLDKPYWKELITKPGYYKTKVVIVKKAGVKYVPYTIRKGYYKNVTKTIKPGYHKNVSYVKRAGYWSSRTVTVRSGYNKTERYKTRSGYWTSRTVTISRGYYRTKRYKISSGRYVTRWSKRNGKWVKRRVWRSARYGSKRVWVSGRTKKVRRWVSAQYSSRKVWVSPVTKRQKYWVSAVKGSRRVYVSPVKKTVRVWVNAVKGKKAVPTKAVTKKVKEWVKPVKSKKWVTHKTVMKKYPAAFGWKKRWVPKPVYKMKKIVLVKPIIKKRLIGYKNIKRRILKWITLYKYYGKSGRQYRKPSLKSLQDKVEKELNKQGKYSFDMLFVNGDLKEAIKKLRDADPHFGIEGISHTDRTVTMSDFYYYKMKYHGGSDKDRENAQIQYKYSLDKKEILKVSALPWSKFKKAKKAYDTSGEAKWSLPKLSVLRDVVVGMVEGVLKAIWDDIKGLNPFSTITGIFKMAGALVKGEYKVLGALAKSMAEPYIYIFKNYKRVIFGQGEPLKNGEARLFGNHLGEIVKQIIELVTGTKMANALIDLAKKVPAVASFIKSVNKVKQVAKDKIKDVGKEIAANAYDNLKKFKDSGVSQRLERGNNSTGNLMNESITKSIELLDKIRDDIKNKNLKLRRRNGQDYEPQKIATAVDVTDPNNPMKHTYGFNRVWDENPSVGADIVDAIGKNKKELAELYVDHNLKTLNDNAYIEKLFREHPQHFKDLGISKDGVIEEMGKLRAMIEVAKKAAIEKNKERAAGSKIYSPGGQPSFEKNWRIENCAEVWAVRNAILSGVKLKNVMLRTINYSTGKSAPLCKNCLETFKELIKNGRVSTTK